MTYWDSEHYHNTHMRDSSGRMVKIQSPTTRAKRNAYYDKHNPGMRRSPDKGQRMYGSCGCNSCQVYRAEFLANLPINESEVSMAQVMICDRCGGMVKGNAIGRITLTTSSDPDNTETIREEICPGCVEHILMFIETEPPTPARAYDKPYVRKPDADAVDEATTEQLAAALLEKLMKAQNTDGPKQISKD